MLTNPFSLLVIRPFFFQIDLQFHSFGFPHPLIVRVEVMLVLQIGPLFICFANEQQILDHFLL